MEKSANFGSQYRPYAGVDVSVSDNNIGTSEYIIRDCLSHVYEEGLQQSVTPFFSFGDLLTGSALSFIGNGIIQWINDPASKYMPDIIIGILCVIGAVFLFYRKFRKVSDRKSDFQRRDTAVDIQIRKLMENSTLKSESSPAKMNYRKY